ncbi:hypothetical protein CBOM_04433 [Ceraceosorus bombacis]|uniref:DUF4203 domain-containing protein n=1 Tax=Ceraceosorus bombacis TaxID=401625 RepID=A0A0P1BQA5_9BASI|nr:hypothetical protein CBOM_04433 [Ceraceosorus bombacis]
MSSGAYFAVWLVPGLLGAALCGHFKFAARLFSGLLGAASLTIILTAMFGIHTLLIRAILVSILAVLLSAPLLLPRSALLQRHLLNLNTSLIGSVVFLNGVALFAPPEKSTESWLNLTAVLFAPDGSDALSAAVDKWGTSAFKGFIAGAVLAVVIGFSFEALLHSHSGEDAEASWNDYLGAYTERYEKSGMLPGQYEGSLARQGLFEPAPTPWQRIAAVFAEAGSARSGPASYGNIPGGQNVDDRDTDADTLTAIPTRKRSRGASSRRTHKSGKTSRGVPARFEALSRRDKDLDLENGDDSESEGDDSDATDVEDVAGDLSKEASDSKSRLSSASKGPATSEQLSALARSTYALPSPLPRPPGSLSTATPLPSYRSDATASTGVGSNVSGSTKVSSVSTAYDGTPHKAFENYRDAGASRAPNSSSRPTSPLNPASGANNGNAVQATPSLINAISRIQAAQAQARAWQAAQSSNSSPYGNQDPTGLPPATSPKTPK